MAPNDTNESERPHPQDDKGIRELALEQGRLIDVTPVTSEGGFRCPVAISEELWRRHGNAQGVDLCSANVVFWLAKAMAQVAAGRRNFSETKTPFGEIWHFKFDYLPEEDDWATIAVKSVLGPDDNGNPVITVLLSTEESIEWELGRRPDTYPMLQEDISVIREEDSLTIRFHAAGIERGDLLHFMGTMGPRLFKNDDFVLCGRLRYEFEGYDEHLRPLRRDLPPLRDFLRRWHDLWPYWFLCSDLESDVPLRMCRLAYPGLNLLAGPRAVGRAVPVAIEEAEHAIRMEGRTMARLMRRAGYLPTQISGRAKTIARLLDLPSWLFPPTD